MFTHNSNGGPEMPGEGQKKIHILLIGNKAAEADEIRKSLGILTGLPCSAWYCSDPTEALAFLCQPHFGIDIIFIDPAVLNGLDPAAYFLQVRQGIPGTPIVLLTARADYDLANVVTGDGVSEGPMSSLVESCLARDKTSVKEPGSATFADMLGPIAILEKVGENRATSTPLGTTSIRGERR